MWLRLEIGTFPLKLQTVQALQKLTFVWLCAANVYLKLNNASHLS
jgi:hypothetical protein